MTNLQLSEALVSRRSVRTFASDPVEASVITRLIEVAQGATGDEGKRSAPSAHAVYPVHLFLAAGRVKGMEPGLYRCEKDTSALTLLHAGDVRKPLHNAAVGDQPWIEECPFILTLCGDAVRVATRFADQMPYGRRGERYMYLEAGAIAQNLMLHAVDEGLGSVLVAGFRDEETAGVLGLEAPLVPVLHLCFGHAR